tara:strand:+ start:124 stop:300 length:177 start_codon:yes stop_codon:yes gene_type:complete
MKFNLEPITLEDVIDEAYEDYCGETDNPLTKVEWKATDLGNQSISKWKSLLGIGEKNV